MNSIKKQMPVLKNVVASVLPQAVNILSNFVLPPLIIASFGSATNGLVSTIKQVVAYVTLVGAGISTSATQALYEPIANKDSVRVSGMIRSIDRMFCHAGYVYLAIVAILAMVYPATIDSSLSYFSTSILIVVMSISGASDFFLAGKYRTLLYADRRMYVQALIQATGLLVGLIGAVLLIKLDANIVLVQLAISLLYVVRILGMHIYIKKKLPQYIQKDVPYVDEAVAKRKDAMLHQLTGLVVTGSQTIILSSFVGLEAASIYAVYNIVFSGLLSICSQVSTAVAPFFGRNYAMQHFSNLNRQYGIVEFVFNNGLAFVLGVASAMIIPFITLYTRGMDINYIDPIVGQLFVLVTFFNIARLPAQQLINVAGHFRETRNRAIIEASSCLLLQLAFVPFFGLYGVLIGVCLSMGWRCVDIIWYVNKFVLNNSPKTSILRLLKAAIIICITSYMSILLLPNIETWIQWIGYAFGLSFITLIIVFIVNFIFEPKRIFLYAKKFFRR